MSKTTGSLSATVIAILLGLGLAPADAANTRSFISANGVDTNSCARTAPCRTLAFAITQTNAGGEINMLDPAGYGPVTITKSISIVNDGVGSAGILVPPSSNGVIILAGPTDAVNLRGLIIEGAGVGGTGIEFLSGKSLTIENCVVRGLTQFGILFQPNASSSLAVSNTFVSNNALGGISVFPVGLNLSVKIALDHIETHNNGNDGISVSGGGSTGTTSATVTDSVASNNVGGMSVFTAPAHAAVNLMVARSVAANNGQGVVADGPGATLWLGQSILTGNTQSWSAQNSGALLSFVDNYIAGNADGDPAPVTIARK
jgi:hypothetical protein